jgi:hypothetical protein
MDDITVEYLPSETTPVKSWCIVHDGGAGHTVEKSLDAALTRARDIATARGSSAWLVVGPNRILLFHP